MAREGLYGCTTIAVIGATGHFGGRICRALVKEPNTRLIVAGRNVTRAAQFAHLFGTGVGTAFFMLQAHRAGSREAMRVTARNVVLADGLFTAPAVVLQLGSGIWLAWRLGISFGSAWFVGVLSLYALVGACWIPVVFIQIRIRDIVAAGGGKDEYGGLMRWWIGLGIPAFGAVLVLFLLMVSKAGVHRQVVG